MCQRIERDWKMAQDISGKRVTTKKIVQGFEDKLDKLFDITKCKCPILTCQERECLGPVKCWDRDHITCICARELKLPVLDLQFLRSQRDKIDEKGKIIISNVGDIEEHKRQVKYLTNKAAKETSIEKRIEKEKRFKRNSLKGWINIILW